jgi:aminotransferase
LRGPQQSVEERRRRYEERRNRVLDVLDVRAVSEGTFYVWIDLPEGITSELLLTKHRVALAPGEGFGARGAGKARISVAVSDEVFERGLERLHGALQQ